MIFTSKIRLVPELFSWGNKNKSTSTFNTVHWLPYILARQNRSQATQAHQSNLIPLTDCTQNAHSMTVQRGQNAHYVPSL